MNFPIAAIAALLLSAGVQAQTSMHKELSEALVCKGDPVMAVQSLVDKGSNFVAGYAAYGFGDFAAAFANWGCENKCGN